MALRKILSSRYLHLEKYSYACSPIATSPLNVNHDHRRLLPSAAATANRWIFLQQRSILQSDNTGTTSIPPIRFPLHLGDNLMDPIRSSMMRDKIRSGAIALPPASLETAHKEEEEEEEGRSRITISVSNARKLIKASRIEAARVRLRTIPSSYISYAEFTEICREAASGMDECAQEILSALDESGAVIVLSDIVFLRPEQVARAIESSILTQTTDDGRKSQLKELEAQKAAIDMKAEAQVRRELWAGFGLVLIQTAGFMRLTFWELSWDVMEPICFFTASFYFMLSYFFFLRTAKEPSFESFFASRFAVKQKQLMKLQSFDLSKLNNLRNIVW